MSSKEKLVNATVRTIYSNGLHGVTTAKIAKEAGLSEAMIYRHFKTKDEMIIKSFLKIKADLNSYVESEIKAQMDFDTKFYKIWLAHIDYFVQNPRSLRVLNQVEHSNYMTDTIRSECLDISGSVTAFFQSGIERLIFKPMHIEIAVAFFFSPILSISESIIENRITRTEEMLALCFRSTSDALKIRKS